MTRASWVLTISLILSAISPASASEWAELTSKPKLSREEKAQLVDKRFSAYILKLEEGQARGIVQSSVDASTRSAIAWTRSGPENPSKEDRLFHNGYLFGQAKKMDPIKAEILFKHSASLYPVDYIQVSLFDALLAAGWEIDRAEFDILTARFLKPTTAPATP